MRNALGLRPFADWLRARDSRSRADIEHEIDEEIAFHLEMRARDLRQAGMSESDARHAAEEQFGDVLRVKDRCRSVQLGERIMLHRLNVILLAVLLAGMVGIGFQSWTAQASAHAEISRMSAEIHRLTSALEASTAAPSTTAASLTASDSGSSRGVVPSSSTAASGASFDLDRESDVWLGRARTVTTWRAGLMFGEEIARLPPEQSLAILTRIWTRIPSVDGRKQLLKAFVFEGAEDNVCDVLHLASTDSEISVQTAAFLYLRGIAVRDFMRDPAEYAIWHRENAGRPLPEILARSMSDLLTRARAASGAELKTAFLRTREIDMRVLDSHVPTEALRTWRSELLHEIERGVESDDESLQKGALDLGVHLGVDDVFRQRVLDPLLSVGSTAHASVRAAAVAALDRTEFEGKTDRLVSLYEQGSDNGTRRDAMSDAALQSLARSQDALVIPAMIKILAGNDGPIARRDVGQALEAITGVPFEDAHDATFWIDWFDKNRHRLPPALQGVQIVRTRGF